VQVGHVRSAAYEAPLTDADAEVLGPEALALAATDPELRATAAGIVWGGRDHPAARIPLRSTDADAFSIVDATTGAVLGLVERARAYSTVHEGAVYLHLGESFLVRELDEAALVAVVEPFSGDWYTQVKHETMTGILGSHASGFRLGLDLHFGEIEVTEHVVAYERRTVSSQERIELVPLSLEPTTFATEALWFLPDAHQLAGLDTLPALLGTLHAAEHALISLLPLWAMCDRWDIGGLSTNAHPETGRPTVFLYDGHPGGIGISQRGFEQFEGWVADTAALLRGCPCVSGCPSCVQSPKCGNLNEFLDKAGALTFLSRLVDFGSARSSSPRQTTKGGLA
jgi:DEAD/DEAH box helicase domain-containing protein